MLALTDRKYKLIWAGMIGLFVLFLMYAVPRINPPRPARHTSLIRAGGVSRTIVRSKDAPRRRGTSLLRYRPRRVEFTSSAGPVDVYVVKFDVGDAHARIDNMMRLTNELQAGQPPPDPIASGSGNEGLVEIPGWWPLGWNQYLVLVRSQNESEVELLIHYEP